MDTCEPELSEVVLFELPAFVNVARFCAGLRPRWRGWSRRDEDVWLVATELGAEDGELALLLRRAQALVREFGLSAIQFCVDDRVYALEAFPAPHQQREQIEAPLAQA
jgi:hypothetical protein